MAAEERARIEENVQHMIDVFFTRTHVDPGSVAFLSKGSLPVQQYCAGFTVRIRLASFDRAGHSCKFLLAF